MEHCRSIGEISVAYIALRLFHPHTLQAPCGTGPNPVIIAAIFRSRLQ